MAEVKTAADLAAETKAAVDKAVSDVKALADEALGKAKANEELSAGFKEQLDEAMLKANEAKGSLAELEQKLARGGAETESKQTAGEIFTSSEGFKAYAGQTSPRGRVAVDVKDISSLTTDAAGSVGTLVQPDRAAPVAIPQRRMTIRSLLAPGTTSSSSVEYDKEVGFTNNAETVAEGATKPQSEIQWEEADAKVVTIAHWMRASVQILADAPALQSMIDQRLRYGLAFKEEQKLLNGAGGTDIEGLVTAASAYSAAFTPASATAIDTLRLAALQVTLAEYGSTGFVLNPIDWARIELTKDTQGRYIVGNPQGQISPTLWGLPVVATQAMTADKFLTGAFNMGAQIFDRQNATVEVSTEDGDNFRVNKVTIRAEERLALAIYRPEAFVYGDLGFVAE